MLHLHTTTEICMCSPLINEAVVGHAYMWLDLNRISMWTLKTHINARCKCYVVTLYPGTIWMQSGYETRVHVRCKQAEKLCTGQKQIKLNCEALQQEVHKLRSIHKNPEQKD